MNDLLFIVLPQFLLSVAALFILPGDTQWLMVTFVSWFLMYVMGEGIFLHKYFSHRSFETHDWIAKVFATFAVLGGYGSPIRFRGIHLEHHKYTDKAGFDPHTPQDGFWHAMGLWYGSGVHFPIIRCKSLLKDKYYCFLEKYAIQILWITAAFLAAFNIKLAIFGLFLPGFIGFLFIGISNTLTHLVGTKRFETDDNSRNIALLSWITWQGGVLHNNHHAVPNRYHDSYAWYEFDIGKYIVPLIATKY